MGRVRDIITRSDLARVSADMAPPDSREKAAVRLALILFDLGRLTNEGGQRDEKRWQVLSNCHLVRDAYRAGLSKDEVDAGLRTLHLAVKRALRASSPSVLTRETRE